jgi:hypothetical protein
MLSVKESLCLKLTWSHRLFASVTINFFKVVTFQGYIVKQLWIQTFKQMKLSKWWRFTTVKVLCTVKWVSYHSVPVSCTYCSDVNCKNTNLCIFIHIVWTFLKFENRKLEHDALNNDFLHAKNGNQVKNKVFAFSYLCCHHNDTVINLLMTIRMSLRLMYLFF